MFLGHYATALVPYELNREKSSAPFWLYLVAAQFLDFVMLALVSANVESFKPELFAEAAFNNMQTDMFVTHDILPVVGWTVLVGLVVALAFKDNRVALSCAALVVVHELCDLVVGFEHFVLGQDTAALGFSLYTKAPVIGLLLEAALCAAILFWFFKRREDANKTVPKGVKIALVVILVGSTLSTLPLATTPLNEMLGL